MKEKSHIPQRLYVQRQILYIAMAVEPTKDFKIKTKSMDAIELGIC